MAGGPDLSLAVSAWGCHRLSTFPVDEELPRPAKEEEEVGRAEIVADLDRACRLPAKLSLPEDVAELEGLYGSNGFSKRPAMAPTLARLARPGTTMLLFDPVSAAGAFWTAERAEDV